MASKLQADGKVRVREAQLHPVRISGDSNFFDGSENSEFW